MALKYAVGDKVKILKETHGHQFEMGEVVIIKHVDSFDFQNPYKAESLDGADYWWVGDDEVESFVEDEVILRASDLPNAEIKGNRVVVSPYSWAEQDIKMDMKYALAIISADHAFKSQPTVEDRLVKIVGVEYSEKILAAFDVTPKS